MSKQTEATLMIDNMACSSCADTVQQTLRNINGVKEASADHEKGIATVTYSDKQVAADDFKQAVEAAEYTFKGMK